MTKHKIDFSDCYCDFVAYTILNSSFDAQTEIILTLENVADIVFSRDMPNITSMSIKDSSTFSVWPPRFEHLVNLRELNIVDCELNDCPPFLPPNLRILNLSQNKIRAIDQNILPNQLVELHLQNNLLTEIDINHENIWLLHINNNVIRKIYNLPRNLRALQLHSNFITFETGENGTDDDMGEEKIIDADVAARINLYENNSFPDDIIWPVSKSIYFNIERTYIDVLKYIDRLPQTLDLKKSKIIIPYVSYDADTRTVIWMSNFRQSAQFDQIKLILTPDLANIIAQYCISSIFFNTR